MTSDAYRFQIIRAVLGTKPAILARAHDLAALDRICEHLAQCEEAHDMLRQKGYGKAGMLIHEVAATVPTKGK
jgi:hypothetical protein